MNFKSPYSSNSQYSARCSCFKLIQGTLFGWGVSLFCATPLSACSWAPSPFSTQSYSKHINEEKQTNIPSSPWLADNLDQIVRRKLVLPGPGQRNSSCRWSSQELWAGQGCTPPCRLGPGYHSIPSHHAGIQTGMNHQLQLSNVK